MLKKILMPLVILGMVFFVQCTDDPYGPEMYNAGKGGGGNGGGGGGNGGSNGDGNGGNGGSNGGNGGGGGVYSDLVIALRTSQGMLVYDYRIGEKDEYGPNPSAIMVDEGTLEPYAIDGVYQTFEYDDLGEMIPVDGYIAKEVQFGRLNVVRAPQSVLESGLAEAIVGLTQDGVSYITTDASGRLVAIIGAADWSVNYDTDEGNDEDDDKTIDAPRENVAIYQELMSNGFSGDLAFLSNYYNESDILTLAFGAIAAGADKTGNMIVDEFGYMNDWLLKWDLIPTENKMSDETGKNYFNYAGFTYSRDNVFGSKNVRITVLNGDGSWDYVYKDIITALEDAGLWTDVARLIDYSNGANTGISGFSNATDDAIQVLEFLHSSDLIVYSPDF